MIPTGCFLDILGRYRCSLCFWYKSNERNDIEHHLPSELGGYCKNGIRCIGENQFECICGKQFSKNTTQDFSPSASTHVDISNCSLKSYCHKCKVQLDCPAALERHNKSKRHIETEGPIFKDLYCKTCQIQTHTQKQMKAHLETNKHKQILEHGSLSLECNTCGITCRGQKQMLSHLETKKHKKLLTNQEA